MFAPWRSQKSVRKHKDPITGNSFIDVSQHVDRMLLYISADTQLLFLLLVSVDTRSADAFSTRDRLLLTTYPYEILEPDKAWRRPCSGQITIHRARHRPDMSLYTF